MRNGIFPDHRHQEQNRYLGIDFLVSIRQGLILAKNESALKFSLINGEWKMTACRCSNCYFGNLEWRQNSVVIVLCRCVPPGSYCIGPPNVFGRDSVGCHVLLQWV